MSASRAPDGVFDSRDLLFYVFVTPDGMATLGGKTRDWQWVAASLRGLADQAESRGLTTDEAPR